MRSPSRDPQKRSIKEEEVIEEHKKSQVGAPVRTTDAFHVHSSSSHPSFFNRSPLVAVVWAILLVFVMLELVIMLQERALLMKDMKIISSRKNSTFF
jgi:hypothetical protein